MGWFGADILDAVEDVATSAADDVAKAASAVADALSSAAKDIGAILHTIAPLISLIPGFGTAIGIALSAAGSLAMGEDILDSTLDAASVAIPAGLPRIGFNGAVAVSKAAVTGGDVMNAVITTCHNAAQAVGGDRAAQAFDAGVSIAKGGKVDDSIIAAGRAQLQASGTTEMLSAYDAGVAVAKGEGASNVILAAGRDYVQAAGGDEALAAFDAGVALAQGQTLQEAGFAALKVFVAGNDTGAKAVQFLQLLQQCAEGGWNLNSYQLVCAALRTELQPLLGQLSIEQFLNPILESFGVDPTNCLAWGSDQLASAWGIAEPAVRAASAIYQTGMQDGQVLFDIANANQISPQAVTALGRKGGLTPVQTAAYFAQLNADAARLGILPICLQAQYAAARNSPIYADLASTCRVATAALSSKQVGAMAIVKTQSVTAKASSALLMSVVGAPPASASSSVVTTPTALNPVPASSAADALLAAGADPSVATGTSPNGLKSDLALGAVIFLACGALFWWATSDDK